MYHLVAADLRDTRVVESALRRVGIDFSAPTIVLAECVLVYMEPRESSALLEVIGHVGRGFTGRFSLAYP